MPTKSCEALSNALWHCCGLPAGSTQEQVHDAFPAQVPGTVASALRALGKWDWNQPVDLDGQDWWFRTTFELPTNSDREPCVLCFDGLASIAEVWLNGECILSADNMFRSYRVEVTEKLRAENQLAIVFRSLAADLKKRRPRPRWKTNLVNNQQLRWLRTSLLGRIPGWSPPAPAVGPWRAVRLEHAPVLLSNVQRTATLEGNTGIVAFCAKLDASVPVKSARLQVGTQEALLACDGEVVDGQLSLDNPTLWWPHTHGVPALFDCSLTIETDAGLSVFPLDRVGFRRIEIHSEPGFAVQVNGERVYCRGACWTTSDIFTLSGSEESLRHDLTLARDAGMNMLRIGGTMAYESDAFYRLCDELGILVWQDFMFANMDYPVEDAAFAENIATEAAQQLDRLAQHPCVAIYCGNSEIEQQAAMLGMARELWRNAWFGEQLPALCHERHPDTAYVPSSPSGGVMPFHTRTGVTHYYGVGAYLRSTRELRQADVKFTSECLGFANIPEPEVIDEIMGGLMPVAHHPRWKQRVPRDTGAGWDFEDVRDHYTRELFGVDPVALRCFDMPRYLELSRVASGEMMSRTLSEWRSAHSNNAGALVWFYKDLWAATGWGVLDHYGMPKAAYYQLRRLMQPRQLTITDEGLDGLHLHFVNELDGLIEGFVEVMLLREPGLVVARHESLISVQQRAKHSFSVDEFIGAFHDVNYAYRFGPPNHHVVVATWFDSQRKVISEAFHFTRARNPEAHSPSASTVQAYVESSSDGRYQIKLQSDRFLHHVRLTAKGWLPDDNYFHLTPERQKTVLLAPFKGQQPTPPKPFIEALNLMGEISVSAKPVTT